MLGREAPRVLNAGDGEESGLNFKSSDRITICGMPGTGKTTLTRHLIALLEPHIFLLDPLDQYREVSDSLKYIPKEDSTEVFEAICRRLCSVGNITFFVEECERYIGQTRPLGRYAFTLVNQGRNWGNGIVAVARRIQALSKDYFDLCQHVIFFRCGLKSRDYIRAMVGREIVQRIEVLPEYHFIWYRLESEQWRECKLQLTSANTGVIQTGNPRGNEAHAERA